MRVSLLFIIPCVFIGGILVGAYYLKDFAPTGSPCALGVCPTTLREGDTGKTFTYRVGTQFKITLDERTNPARNLFCGPAGVVENVPDAFSAAPPLYTGVFQGIAPGTCTLSSNSFIATIIVQ
jgi:hypothetical protein